MKLSEYKLLLKYTAENNIKVSVTCTIKHFTEKIIYNTPEFKFYLINHYFNLTKQSLIKMIRDFKLKRSIKKFIKG